MGINKRTSFVIHYDLPKNIEATTRKPAARAAMDAERMSAGLFRPGDA